MANNALASLILVLSTFGSIQGADSNGANYSQLKRLHVVLELPSFPSPSQDGIQTWHQRGASHGVVNKFDFTKFPLNTYDELPLSAIVKFYGGKNMSNDLTNVVIISNAGRSVRFIDFNESTGTIGVRRGEVVAFLLTEAAK